MYGIDDDPSLPYATTGVIIGVSLFFVVFGLFAVLAAFGPSPSTHHYGCST